MREGHDEVLARGLELERKEQEREAAKLYFYKQGKVDINTLLWTWLPPNTTLGRADNLAEKIFAMIDREWDNPAPPSAECEGGAGRDALEEVE